MRELESFNYTCRAQPQVATYLPTKVGIFSPPTFGIRALLVLQADEIIPTDPSYLDARVQVWRLQTLRPVARPYQQLHLPQPVNVLGPEATPGVHI